MENQSNTISWIDRDIARFHKEGRIIPPLQTKIYRAISEEWTSGRTVLDVGCSIGIGTNILSYYSRFTWGIDMNGEAISFAKAAFTRPNLDFEVIDIENPPTRPLSKFERIVCVEVIEHLPNYEQGLAYIKQFFDKGSVGFITVPNINNPRVKAADARNTLHVNHWTAGEFYELMIKHFGSVVLYNASKLKKWDHAETVDGNSACRLILAKVEDPK